MLPFTLSFNLLALHPSSLSPISKAYEGQNIVLLLPAGVETIQLQWLSIWCRSFDNDLASAVFPGEAYRPPPPEGVTILQVSFCATLCANHDAQ